MKRILLWGLLSILACLASAQSPAYRIQVDDVVRIQVYDEEQVNASVPVDPEGNIKAPFVGTVKAAGKTVDELEKELVDLYIRELRLKEPLVSVTIERFRPVRASVGGMVARPAIYDMRPGDTLLTLLNMGGGPLTDTIADLRRATLRRKGSQELIPIDLFALINRGDMSQNYVIQDGDELTVPRTDRNVIVVSGQVRQPGLYPYRDPMRLADAISLAGGEIPFKSKFSKIVVIREDPGRPGEYVRIQADLVKFLRKGDGTQNVLLEPGDTVVVPDSGNIDFNQINAIANVFFILDRFGLSIFGR